MIYVNLQFVGGSNQIKRILWEETNTYATFHADLPVTGVVVDAFGDYPSSANNIIVNGTLSASDDDGDSLPDGWELATLGTTNYLSADNPDGDTLSNQQEYIAGLNPLRPDALLITGLDFSDASTTNRVLSWPFVYGREYAVYWAANIHHVFVPVATQVTYSDDLHGNEPGGFYKLEIMKQVE